MIMSDKLFLAWNCNNCTKIKAHISESMFSDSVGTDGQILTVVHTFSNDGTRDILDTFGLDNSHAPVLLTHNDNIIDDPDKIISYLKDSGLAN